MPGGLIRPAEGSSFSYAGRDLTVLAGDRPGDPWAIAEMVIPARFPGPVPHVHTTFDEGIYVIEGTLQVISGDADPEDAPAGSMFTAVRGRRHGFRNPGDTPVRILGLWSPAGAGLDFMRAVGPALPASGPPDPEALRAVYAAHASYLQP